MLYRGKKRSTNAKDDESINMLKVKYFWWFLVVWLVISGPAHCTDIAFESDSLRIQKRAAYWVIVHEVDPGETVYALSRRYAVSVEQILKLNPVAENDLHVGQLLYIPFSSSKYYMHKVKKGETLYSISILFHISVNELKMWNKLAENDIHIDQELKILEIRAEILPVQSSKWIYHTTVAGETLYSIAGKYQVTVDDLKNWNALVSDEIVVGQQLRMPAGDDTVMEQPRADIDEKDVSNKNEQFVDKNDIDEMKASGMPGLPVLDFPMKEERGLAALIEGTGSSNKYLALHRSASPGTILMVRNEMNNQVVFVRVIGRLPDTGANAKVIVKISKAAWETINAVNPKLRVKVSYFR